MGGVQIWCPNSGLWAWTDVEVDRGQWAPSSLAGQELLCGICGERHRASTRGLRVPEWTRASLAS